MTTCDVAEDLIERHLDGETTGAEETALRNHLSGCESCSRRSDREAALHARLVVAFANAMPSPGFGPGRSAASAAKRRPGAWNGSLRPSTPVARSSWSS